MRKMSWPIALIMILGGCISKTRYQALNQDYGRLKNDSNLMEKRIQKLQQEVNLLSEESALIEQSLNARLQEKEDSLNYKAALLVERETSLKDMKARREEEKEAFNNLSKQIIKEFADYDAGTLTYSTNCTQVLIEVNEQKLFTAKSIKPEYFAFELNTKVVALMERFPDLQVEIRAYYDSTAQIVGKEKPIEPWLLAAQRAHQLSQLVTQAEKQFIPRTHSGIKNWYSAPKGSPKYKIAYLFRSELLPCLHIK